MPEETIREALFAAIQSVAPEADPETVPPDADFREELDIDSMDFQSIALKLEEALAIKIPDKDMTELVTLDGAVAYLMARTAG